MAKAQSFADKVKKKKKSDHITVKFVKAVKTDKGNYTITGASDSEIEFFNKKDFSDLSNTLYKNL